MENYSLGMDIRIKCEGCGHSVMLPRREFTKKMKKVLQSMRSDHAFFLSEGSPELSHYSYLSF